jgi:hypothetical protein
MGPPIGSPLGRRLGRPLVVLLVGELLVDYPTLDNPTDRSHPLSTIPLNIVFIRNREMGDEMRYR